MKISVQILWLMFIVGCQSTDKTDVKKTLISFDLAPFDANKFRELLADSISVSFADTLINQIQKEHCLQFITVKNSSDSSIWVFYFNRNIPKLSPEKITNYSLDSANNSQIKGDQIIELFGAELMEIKPNQTKVFLSCPYLPNGYSYYEMAFSYAKQKNARTFETYILKCRFQRDLLVKIE
jgi:hypothetical protein